MNLTDRLIAPNATRGEVVTGFGAAFGGAALAFGLALHAQLSWLSVAVVTLVAFDMFGGAVVNATDSAKRWYHRPDRTSLHHLAFVAIHVQPFLLALVVPGFTWLAATVIYASALTGAALVTAAPRELRRPIAFGATAAALTITTSMLIIPHVVAWFAPLLLIKLLLAHLLPENAAR
ncbi:hypothetical protein [Nocardia sp. XZ_19_369]|uniref:hypothetical protein n=1 Tax=Nocardia sp. XZ_19_369 TaxID=2769487 RepID=UPI00188E00F6|nr:hypothetical protein [Nocardia sp. XZ_19_369]